jgi:hypothetical protein
MRALTWHGRHDVRVDTVPDPEIVNPPVQYSSLGMSHRTGRKSRCSERK